MKAVGEKVKGELAVELAPLKHFVPAEDVHQDYLEKFPGGYCHINADLAYEPLFDEEYKFSDEEIKKLDRISTGVMLKDETERPYTSELDREYRKGIYVDKLTGEPLFSSSEKYDSGCGWPAFSRPIMTGKIEEKEDLSHGMIRTEVRTVNSDIHLGHVFNDGPAEKGSLRYCINGAALRFIPYEDMEYEGYGEYKVFCR